MSTPGNLDTESELSFERSLYVGGQITAILYGIQLVLYLLSNRLLLNSSRRGRDANFYVIYGTILLILWTIALACNALFGQYAWIDHRDVDGPAAYIEENISAAYNTLGTTAGVIMNFLSDGLLIYRCYILWSSWKVIIFPIFLYFGGLSMSILLIYESAQPGANFFVGHAVDFGVPYISLTISLNIIVTGLICGRLLYLRNEVNKILGPTHAKMYTSIIAILVESAALFTILGIVYVVVYARKSQTSIALVQVWGDFCAISPQLIILRIAMGHGWTKDTVGKLTTPTVTFSTHFDTEKDSSPTSIDAPLSLRYSSEHTV
ncbi:hypothetical protein F5879DRAFT_378873 [Lentinula edodes]|uniref:Uncharacterized protein n=1 Tax=Lentinula lateritia TaxID=40482 RepID=A0A9W9A067_9AGAR|nr:hypothetical protein F5879DRAFT_378873 [Lentinula edodes]KAJ3923123.1 hypothetical protein F5877DRAFT_32136 [Lentinula edodes]KAJ4471291.1 hypothetical protein C8J55DRAFT_563602 [Lentinula edodes]